MNWIDSINVSIKGWQERYHPLGSTRTRRQHFKKKQRAKDMFIIDTGPFDLKNASVTINIFNCCFTFRRGLPFFTVDILYYWVQNVLNRYNWWHVSVPVRHTTVGVLYTHVMELTIPWDRTVMVIVSSKENRNCLPFLYSEMVDNLFSQNEALCLINQVRSTWQHQKTQMNI